MITGYDVIPEDFLPWSQPEDGTHSSNRGTQFSQTTSSYNQPNNQSPHHGNTNGRATTVPPQQTGQLGQQELVTRTPVTRTTRFANNIQTTTLSSAEMARRIRDAKRRNKTG